MPFPFSSVFIEQPVSNRRGPGFSPALHPCMLPPLLPLLWSPCHQARSTYTTIDNPQGSSNTDDIYAQPFKKDAGSARTAPRPAAAAPVAPPLPPRVRQLGFEPATLWGILGGGCTCSDLRASVRLNSTTRFVAIAPPCHG